MSIAGGLPLAAERAHEAGCDCLQIFTKNNNQWQCKALSDQECQSFREAVQQFGLKAPIAHASYLLNLATPDPLLWRKSVDALVVEWQRCEHLRLEGLVIHPGAYTTATPEAGLQHITAAVHAALAQVQPRYCRLLLENTAGQGTCLGWQIEQLGWLLSAIDSTHIGICWDTCHALAAGYDFRTAAGLKQLVSQLEAAGVMGRIAAIHINDSKKDCGSRVDRHEHIGLGYIGDDGFRRFLRCSAFKSLPMYLETPKAVDPMTGVEWDIQNLAKLRQLCRR